MVVTNVFRIKINVVDIKIIIYTNELKTILDYAQENK